MPFKSKKQRAFLWANHPEIARHWTNEHGSTPVAEETPRQQALKKRINGRSRS